MLDQNEVVACIEMLSKALRENGKPVPKLTGVDVVLDLETLEAAMKEHGMKPYNYSQAKEPERLSPQKENQTEANSVTEQLCSITDPKQRTEFYQKHRAQIIAERHNRLLGK